MRRERKKSPGVFGLHGEIEQAIAKAFRKLLYVQQRRLPNHEGFILYDRTGKRVQATLVNGQWRLYSSSWAWMEPPSGFVETALRSLEAGYSKEDIMNALKICYRASSKKTSVLELEKSYSESREINVSSARKDKVENLDKKRRNQ